MKKIALIFFLLFNHLTHRKSYILITTLYNETNHERTKEYITCLKKNLRHPLIDKIHVLYDTTKDNQGTLYLHNFLLKHHIEITYIQGRATYQQCFDIANEYYHSKHIIVSNGDIYFNKTLHKLKKYDLTGKFLAITRWNQNKDGSLSKTYTILNEPLYGSQDTWIFKSPICKFANANIKLGLVGCDGAISKEAKRTALKVINPCLSIQCCHLHLSNIRNYSSMPCYSDNTLVQWTHL